MKEQYTNPRSNGYYSSTPPTEQPPKRSGALTFLLVLAILLLIAAGGMYGYDWYESYLAEKSSAEAMELLKNPTSDESLTEDYLGIVEIPSIGVELPVFNSWDYDKLSCAPCVYSGSIAEDDIIIIGHDYQAHFANLGYVKAGDQITLKTLSGQVIIYSVTGLCEIDGNDSGTMYSGDWDMTLYTCNSTGNKRITVRCDRTD